MLSRLIFLFYLFIFILSGCASSIMSISEDQTKKVNPIGLYIIVSTQLLFTDAYKHNKLIIRLITDFLPGLFAKKGYLIKPLNAKVKKAEVFEKYSFYFDISEERIAEVGANEGCSSVLIVYLSYKGDTLRFKNGFNTYQECSLYGWLVDTKSGSVISSSRMPPSSFDAFLENRPSSVNEGRDFKAYRRFIRYIIFEMFGHFPRRAGVRHLP